MQGEIPIRQEKRRGRRWPLPRVNVAWCYDFRGDNDDELTFMFKGAPAWMVDRVFAFLCARGNGCARDFRITEGHDPIRRQGRCYHRLMVTLEDYHQRFAAPKEIMLLIESLLKQMTAGKLMPCAVDDFINI